MHIVLPLVIKLSQGNQTTEALCELLKISPATLKREIAMARHLGAKIQAVKQGKKSEYQLDNWIECKTRTERWHELNTTKNLQDQKKLDL